MSDMPRTRGGAAAAMLLLRGVPYFAELPDEVLAAVAAAAVPRSYARGEIIFLESEPAAGLYIVAEGEVKVYKVSLQGREQILHVLGRGGTFNDVAALDGGPNPASAAASTAAVIYVFDRDEIRRLAQVYPALAWALIESIARRARHLVQMVEDLSLRSVKGRLARLLLAQAERSATKSEVGREQLISQTEIAARLGTVREMVGRALRELVDDGLITQERHRIIIVDRTRLAEVAES